MTVRFRPSKLSGRVAAPPSKSVAHRALIAAAMTGGVTVQHLALSEDIAATVDGLRALGADIRLSGDAAEVGGLSVRALPERATLPCRESGSTLRFLLPLCLLSPGEITLTGAPRLLQRPLGVYKTLCAERGLLFRRDETGITVGGGPLSGGTFSVPGNVSSQFITGLLMTLPLLSGDSTLQVVGAFESASYVDITLSVLAAFGIEVRRDGQTFVIPGGQTYRRDEPYAVEGDFSNAANLDGFRLLGGAVEVTGLPAGDDSRQGDRVYRALFDALAAGGRDFDLSDCPDLGPILFALAAFRGGQTVFRGTARLRLKESDRVDSMRAELLKFGASVRDDGNAVTVSADALHAPTERLCGHNDHRVVMALAALCTVFGGTIDGAEAVSKSFPDYFDTIRALGADFDKE